MSKDDLELCKSFLERFEASMDVDTSKETEKEYFKILNGVFGDVPVMLAGVQSIKESKKGKAHYVIKRYTAALVKFFGEDAVVSPDALSVGLTGLSAWIPLLRHFPETRKKLVLRAIAIWASDALDQARLGAMLALHKAATESPKLLESVILRKMYAAFGKACKSLTIHSMGQATFMLNGLVEVFALDPSRTLRFASKAIRALATLLQSVVKTPSKETIRKYYGWSVVWSLKFWARLCTTKPADSDSTACWEGLEGALLKLTAASMAYNLVPRFYPFHFHLIGASNEISRAKQVFIPVAPALLMCLEHIVATQTKPDTTGKPKVYDFTTNVKVAKAESSSRAYLDCAGEEALFLLGESLMAWSHHPAFPEMALPIIQQLRAVESINKGWKIAKLCSTLAAKLEQHALMVAKLRADKGDMVPSKTLSGIRMEISADKDILDQFHRHCQRVREQRRRLVASATDNSTYRKPDVGEGAAVEDGKAKASKKGSKAGSTDPVRKSRKSGDLGGAHQDEFSGILASIEKVKKAAKGQTKKSAVDKLVERGPKVKRRRTAAAGSSDDGSHLEDFDLDNF